MVYAEGCEGEGGVLLMGGGGKEMAEELTCLHSGSQNGIGIIE
jgi:hypothetical protein